MDKHRATIIFIILSAAASFFNYILYPLIARILEREAFVQVTVALALFTQISSFTLSIVALTIGLSKKQNNSQSKALVEQLQTVLVHLFLVIVALSAITLPLFIHKINIDASLLLPITGMLMLSIYMSVISGYLNGKQKLVKLGIALALLAFLQLAFSVLGAFVTQSGLATLYSMLFAGIISIIIIFVAYKDEDLPHLSSVIGHKLSIYRSKHVRSLVRYTILSSISVLVLNILLILDLLIINSRRVDSEIYAGIYIISRVVFFAGMLLVWPFLAKIELNNQKQNRKLMTTISSCFIAISILAMTIMWAFGEQVNQVILGGAGSTENFEAMTFLAIMYKLIYLILTAIVLFLIVMRSYWAVTLPLLLAFALTLSQVFLPINETTIDILKVLVGISSLGLMAGITSFIIVTKNNR